MNVLITGGAGFIGSHLADRLINDGYEVSILDDLSTGTLDNLIQLRKAPGFDCVIGSVRNAVLVDDMVARADAVVHLAAAVGVKKIMDEPSQSILVNVNGTETVLASAAARGKPIIIASTSEVYGKSARIPFAEDDDVLLGPTSKARWSYAYAKAIDECLALAYVQEDRAHATVVRFFNTAGPRQTGRYGMVLPAFVDAALRNQPIEVHGDGNQRRCFAHVRDVVEVLSRLVAAGNVSGEVFNVGNDQEISILALAELVKMRTHSRSEIRFRPYVDVYGTGFEDMMRRVPDVSKLERFIGYRPRTGIEQLIDDVVAQKRNAFGLV